MRTTTVVHRRATARLADFAAPCSRRRAAVQLAPRPSLRRSAGVSSLPVPHPWSTARLGVVLSTMAVVVTLVLHASTSLQSQAIVLSVMVVSFAASLRSTTRRPLTHR